MPSSKKPTDPRRAPRPASPPPTPPLAGPRVSARRLCLDALAAFHRGDAPADELLESAGRPLPRGSRERAFLTDLFYGVLRNLSLLDAWIARLRDGATDPATRDLLRAGLCQILLSGVAPHAAVNETVALAGPARGLVNAVLRRAIRERADLLAFAETLPPHIRWSHPLFLYNRWRDRLGPDEAAALMRWNNQPARVFARVNTLRTTPEALLQNPPPGVEPVTSPAPAPAVRCRAVPVEAVRDGLLYIQDLSTLHAPVLLNPQPGELVLDACAAPGGKTAHLAALMQNRGRLIAADASPSRIRRMLENLDRLGVTCAEPVRHDWLADTLPAGWEGRFDKILLDVPCSNTGVLRRRVDARWRLRPEDFTRLPAAQLRILEAASKLLKPGGALVYSTCSIEPEENEQVISAFLAAHPGWRADPAHPPRTLLPHRDDCDGAFLARLIRC